MVQGLLLDGIDAEACAAAVRGEYHFAVDVLPNEAEATVAFLEQALARTEVTEDAVTAASPPATRTQAVGAMWRRWQEDGVDHRREDTELPLGNHL